jgi:hypothetical protein
VRFLIAKVIDGLCLCCLHSALWFLVLQCFVCQARENLLGQPLGVVCFSKQVLPDLILMGCLLPHLAVDQPKPENSNQDIEGKHDKSPESEICIHGATVQYLSREFICGRCWNQLNNLGLDLHGTPEGQTE